MAPTQRLQCLQMCVLQVDGAPGVSGTEYRTFWLNIDRGLFTAGSGEPGSGLFHTWQDPQPRLSCNAVGLSTWDKHVSYRNMRAISGLPQTSSAPNCIQVWIVPSPRLPCIAHVSTMSCVSTAVRSGRPLHPLLLLASRHARHYSLHNGMQQDRCCQVCRQHAGQQAG